MSQDKPEPPKVRFRQLSTSQGVTSEPALLPPVKAKDGSITPPTVRFRSFGYNPPPLPDAPPQPSADPPPQAGPKVKFRQPDQHAASPVLQPTSRTARLVGQAPPEPGVSIDTSQARESRSSGGTGAYEAYQAPALDAGDPEPTSPPRLIVRRVEVEIVLPPGVHFTRASRRPEMLVAALLFVLVILGSFVQSRRQPSPTTGSDLPVRSGQ